MGFLEGGGTQGGLWAEGRVDCGARVTRQRRVEVLSPALSMYSEQHLGQTDWVGSSRLQGADQRRLSTQTPPSLPPPPRLLPLPGLPAPARFQSRLTRPPCLPVRSARPVPAGPTGRPLGRRPPASAQGSFCPPPHASLCVPAAEGGGGGEEITHGQVGIGLGSGPRATCAWPGIVGNSSLSTIEAGETGRPGAFV